MAELPAMDWLKSTLKEWESLAAFLAAFGTIAAVVVALIQARRNVVRLKVSTAIAAFGQGFSIGGAINRLESMTIHIVVSNPSRVDVILSHFRWEVPILNRIEYQVPDVFNLSGKGPTELKAQRQAWFEFELKENHEMWRQEILRTLLRPWPRLMVHFARVAVITQAGERFVGRFDPNLRKYLREGTAPR